MYAAGQWSARPVFITSTFRDMQAERDYLRTHVFPALEERLRERRCHLEPIDLRWGVETVDQSDEAAKELVVLKVCLAEIERSRPFLLVLIGDRYGWVPPRERVESAAREAGLSAEVVGKSVTELEIEFGVLGSPEQERRSLFYFRAPLPWDAMGDGTAAEYSEERRGEEGAEAALRLKTLKARIEERVPSNRLRHYRAIWDPATQRVTGLEDFGHMVLEDLWRELDAATGHHLTAEPGSWQGAQKALLDEFVATRSRGFVGRDALLRELVAHAASAQNEVRALCVTGEAGSGKSAVLATLTRRLSEPTQQTQGLDSLVLAHAAGISPASSCVDAMLRLWIDELGRAVGVDRPLSDGASDHDVETAFHELLRRASTQRRVVLLIDALNEFEPTTRARYLTWLPRPIPENVRMITTAIPGTASDALLEHGGKARPLPPLGETEAREIIGDICRRYHRTLNAQALDAVLAKQLPDGTLAAGNALWLELAIEHLNLLDADDFARADWEFAGEADARVLQLILAVIAELPCTVSALYEWMLERAEKIFGHSWVESFVTLTAIARSGWRESDYQVLLPVVSGQPWNALEFANLRRTFRAHVVRNGTQGQWDFAHSQMREAVQQRYLTDARKTTGLHARVASHLEGLPSEDPLRQGETMVHFIAAADQQHAARYYANALQPAELEGANRALIDWLREDSTGAHLTWLKSLLEPGKVPHEALGRIAGRFVRT